MGEAALFYDGGGGKGECWGGGRRTREELRSHVDGRSHDAAGHHGLRFAEAQVSYLCTVLLVQLPTEDSPLPLT